MKKTKTKAETKAVQTKPTPKPYPILDELEIKPLMTGGEKIIYGKTDKK